MIEALRPGLGAGGWRLKGVPSLNSVGALLSASTGAPRAQDGYLVMHSWDRQPQLLTQVDVGPAGQ